MRSFVAKGSNLGKKDRAIVIGRGRGQSDRGRQGVTILLIEFIQNLSGVAAETKLKYHRHKQDRHIP
jgi:hypothetical protein